MINVQVITEENNDFFCHILSGWFKEKLHELFLVNQNALMPTKDQ